MKTSQNALRFSVHIFLNCLAAGILCLSLAIFSDVAPASSSAISGGDTHSIKILVDDFKPQPYQRESIYFYNRLEGDRGMVGSSLLDWGNGQVKLTITPGSSWGGVWTSLNHPIREGLPINFSMILPSQILQEYQSQITGITVRIKQGTAGKTFRVELKDVNDVLHWYQEITLNGGLQFFDFSLPTLGNINKLVWVLDHAAAGDFVVVDLITLTATTRIADSATAAFVWSYGMLLNNWNPDTGLVRDKAKDASGEFDAIQGTGSLAAATAVANQLGIISSPDAVGIVKKIGDTLLTKIPKLHGLWPHWVKGATTDQIINVGEWSSVDTVIAAIGLLDAQNALKLDTSGTTNMLRMIDWSDLISLNCISHGYYEDGSLIPFCWDVFGGESWLVELAYASVTGQVAPLPYPSPPTANGSGFIDELAWLFIWPPSVKKDYWETNWIKYLWGAADDQISYYPTNYPGGCFDYFNLFGLSAAEVPDPSKVNKEDIYQAFGVGGLVQGAQDGSVLLGTPVIVPHYSAMISYLRPKKAIHMWDWFIENEYFSPLNNVESLLFPSTTCDSPAIWNQLKGSWNLALQTIGLGKYLAQNRRQIPILWKATVENSLLRKGYHLLVPGR